MSARDYLEGFAVQEAITAALGAVIAERPANPIKALSKKLLDAEEKREEGKMLATSPRVAVGILTVLRSSVPT